MKLSNYIVHLQNTLAHHGDLDCVTWTENDDWDSSTEGWWKSVSEEEMKESIESKIESACTYFNKQSEKLFCSTNDIGYIDCKKEKVFEIKL